MIKFINALSRKAVSAHGLLLFNFIVFVINSRFMARVVPLFADFDKFDAEQFLAYGGAAAVRMIAVGVLILERHDILELSGAIPRGAPHDDLTNKTHPFGTYYLCFGLIMECVVDQVHVPFDLLAGPSFNRFLVYTATAITFVGLLACLHLYKILLYSILDNRKNLVAFSHAKDHHRS